MSDEIVRRLRNRSQQRLNALKESMPVHGIKEADEDEIPEEDVDMDTSEEEDDSTAPEQGSPDDDIPEPEIGEEEGEEDKEELSPDDEEAMDPEEGEGYINPLDNSYATKFTIGSEVVMAYANGSKSKLKGVVDGYDTEGFYRIKWANGLTTNGITDIALADIIDSVEENTCVCGNTAFVHEGDTLVCDSCGRPHKSQAEPKVNESSDPLAMADKSRPKGKRMIRSEAHPVSTSIQDSIRSAFKKKNTVKESKLEYKGYEIYSPTEEDDYEVYIRKDGKDLLDDRGNKLQFNWNKDAKKYIDSLNESEDEEFTKFNNLRSNLEGEFWTRMSELVADIEELGYDVLDYNAEYVVVSKEEDEEIQIPIAGTSRTMTLDFSKARVL